MELLKQTVTSILCIGIFIAILELIMPKTKNKKYIYIIVGIAIITTMLSPMKGLLTDFSPNFESFFQNFEVVDAVGEVDNVNLIKEEFMKNLKKDIESKLTLRGVRVKSVYVSIDDEYNITKIQVNIKSGGNTTIENVNTIARYINEEYDIDFSKIEVVEGE